jgi:hypothetical protein
MTRISLKLEYLPPGKFVVVLMRVFTKLFSHFIPLTYKAHKCLNGHLIDRVLFDQNSLDQNCVFSVDRNFHNQLIKFFETSQLIEKFDQVPKNNLRILAVDRKF